MRCPTANANRDAMNDADVALYRFRASIAAIALAFLAIVAVSRLGWGFWTLVLGLSAAIVAFYGFTIGARVKRRRRQSEESRWRSHGRRMPRDSLLSSEFEVPAYNTFGRFRFDRDEGYGLFIRIKGRPVFIDAREDRLLEDRVAFAREIADNASAVSTSFDALVRGNAALEERGVGSIRIVSIGLYDKWDARHGEVTLVADDRDDGWTCSLRGLSFQGLEYSD